MVGFIALRWCLFMKKSSLIHLYELVYFLICHSLSNVEGIMKYNETLHLYFPCLNILDIKNIIHMGKRNHVCACIYIFSIWGQRVGEWKTCRLYELN